MFNLNAQGVWRSLGSTIAYRWVSQDIKYQANEAWPGNNRFDDRDTPTLYVSLTPEGAVAEYLRWHPKFILDQQEVKLDIFEMQIVAESDGLDISEESAANAVGIRWDRLKSSDYDREVRYRECQQLAREVIDATGISIKYPSAALEGGINVVLFQTRASSWTVHQGNRIEVPWVEPALVTPLPNRT